MNCKYIDERNAKEKQKEEESFAMVMLKECSKMAKRYFIISIIEGLIIITMIVSAYWFISTSDIESYDMQTHGGGNANIVRDGGTINNGTN